MAYRKNSFRVLHGEEAQRMHDAGLSTRAIGRHFGISHHSVARALCPKERLIPFYKTHGDEIKRLYVDCGLSSREVAKRIGVSYTYVLRALREAGVARRAAQGGKPPSKQMLRVREGLVRYGHITRVELAQKLGMSWEAIRYAETCLGAPSRMSRHFVPWIERQRREAA